MFRSRSKLIPMDRFTEQSAFSKDESTPDILLSRSNDPLRDVSILPTEKAPERPTLFKLMMINMNVKTFIYNLRKFHDRKKSLPYSRAHFSIINDSCGADLDTMKFKTPVDVNSLKSVDKRPNCWKRTKKRIRRGYRRFTRSAPMMQLQQWSQRVLRRIPITNPDSIYKASWDACIAILVAILIVLIPVEVCVSNTIFAVPPYNSVFILCALTLFLDLLLNLNTGQFVRGQLVQSRTKIFHHMMRQGLVWKSLSLMILVNYFWYAETYTDDRAKPERILLFSFYSYFGQLYDFKDRMESQISLKTFKKSIFEIIKLILTLVFINHFFSCVWVLIGRYSDEMQEVQVNWLSSKDLAHATPTVQYINALYFTHVTMTSVGYGDITPQRDHYEKLFCVFYLIMSTIALSYGIGTVGQIIQQLFSFKDREIQKLSIINQYMARHKFDISLKNRVREYLKYIWECQQSDDTEQEQNILGDLSEELRCIIKDCINEKVLQHCRFLTRNFSAAFLKALGQNLQTMSIVHEDNIEFDEPTNPYLMYVESGAIDVLLRRHDGHGETRVGHYSKGKFFGIDEFVVGQKQAITYQSHGFTKICYLPRKKFLDLLANFHADRERFQYILEKIDIFHDYSQLHQKCISCFSDKHLIYQCQFVHFLADRERVVKCYQFPTKQRYRSIFHRNPKRPRNFFSSRYHLQDITEQAVTIAKDYEHVARIYGFDDMVQANQSNTEMVEEAMPSMDNGRSLSVIQESGSDEGDSGASSIPGPSFRVKASILALKTFALKKPKALDSIAYWRDSLQRKYDNRKELLPILGERHVRSLELLYMQLHSMCDKSVFSLTELDQMRDYQAYRPDQNPETVIQRANQISVVNLQQRQHSRKAASEQRRMSVFLIHPNEYIEKYRPDLLLIQMKDKEKESNVRERDQYQSSKSLLKKSRR